MSNRRDGTPTRVGSVGVYLVSACTSTAVVRIGEPLHRVQLGDVGTNPCAVCLSRGAWETQSSSAECAASHKRTPLFLTGSELIPKVGRGQRVDKKRVQLYPGSVTGVLGSASHLLSPIYNGPPASRENSACSKSSKIYFFVLLLWLTARDIALLSAPTNKRLTRPPPPPSGTANRPRAGSTTKACSLQSLRIQWAFTRFFFSIIDSERVVGGSTPTTCRMPAAQNCT